jgi:hypothetical protein
MPKLNDTHLADRLNKRIAELEADKEVAAKDIRAVLTDEQVVALDAAWAEQQQLRKGKRATTEEQQRALGWKSKREVRLEILNKALKQAEANAVQFWKDAVVKSKVRGAKVYMDAYFAARAEEHDKYRAEAMANNALTRSGISRADGKQVHKQGLNKRDREVFELEQNLKKVLGIKDEEDLNAHIVDVKKRRTVKKAD